MADREVHPDIKPLVMTFLDQLMKNYWGPLHQYIKANPHLKEVVPGFLLDLKKIYIYVGNTHIAVEYTGSEVLQQLKEEGNAQIEFRDFSKKKSLLEQIIGFEYDSTTDFSSHLLPFTEDLILPTNRGWDKLFELGWNTSAQNGILAFNSPCPEPKPDTFARIVNGMFFDSDSSGLKSRRIKWIDFFPINYDDNDDQVDIFSFDITPIKNFIEHDSHYKYPMPDDYKFIQLPKINRFIEVWGNEKSTETDITSHLAKKENEFILTMKFGAEKIYPELNCKWQSESREDIRPDFFVLQPNGYADIVEFKLPKVSKNSVVGTANRESFGAWLNSYISQTRVYSTYFNDPNNRRWFESKYGFKVHNPRRWLVVGRRNDFDSEVWREIVADYKDLEILTFDDLIDGVVVQFYK